MSKFSDVAHYQQIGDVMKAEQTLNSLVNVNELDAASNEDARVQLDELQKQKITLCLQTRRQRLYLDNRLQDDTLLRNSQLELAATQNPLINGETNFKPTEMSNLLLGNSQSENEVLNRIAARITAHQQSSEPAPKNIAVDLPEESRVYTFQRTVQVKGDEALELSLKFANTTPDPSKFKYLGLPLTIVLTLLLLFTLNHFRKETL